MDEPIYVFAASYVVSGLCGLAMLLRSDVDLSIRNIFATVLYNGLLGLSISLVSFEWLGSRAWFTIGLAMLSGLGGLRAADILVLVCRQLGLTIASLMDQGKRGS